MKVMRSNLSPSGKTSAIIEPRADSTLHRFHNFLVFHLDLVQVATHSLRAQRLVPDVRYERHPGACRPQRAHDVHRETPGVEVQHEVREEPEVERRHPLAVIGMAFRK